MLAPGSLADDLAEQITLVPDELLDPLDPADSRGVYKNEAAELVDDYLRRLSRREALGRVALGRIAAVFLRRSFHHALTFAHVSDYTRERLGIGASQFYELARVSRELERLPQIAAAFERGQIGWTKLRELTAAATPDTEADWLALAHRYTTDGLKIIVRRPRRHASGEASGGPLGGGASAVAGPPGAGVSPGEGLEQFAREAVREAVEEARREASMLDFDGNLACDTEVNPTEAQRDAAALDDDEIEGEPTTVFRMRCPRRVRRLWFRARELARRVAGTDLADWNAAEAIAAESIADSGSAPDDSRVASFMQRAAIPRYRANMLSECYLQEAHKESFPWGEDYDEVDVIRWHRETDLVDDELPEALAELARDLDGVDAHELDARMHAILAAMQRIDWQMGCLLRTFFGLRLYRELGYRNEGAYVRNRLGMCSRKARGLVALERKSLVTSSALTSAYRDGRLSWYRCLMLLPVLTEENAEAWIERACAVTTRRLRDELEWALEIMGNAPLGAAVFPPPMGDPLKARPCRCCGAEHDYREFDRCERDRSKQGDIDRAEHDDVDAAEHEGTHSAACADMNGRPIGREWQIGGDAERPCPALLYAGEAVADVEVRVRGPVSVVSLLYSAVIARTRTGEPPWRGFERVLLHAIESWESLPKHRDPVFGRDGWRCATPGCGSRRNLNDHHIIFRSHGGGNARDNRITLCVWHHLRGIHIGKMRLRGKSTRVLAWELGVRPSGPPLMRLRGEAYDENVLNEPVCAVL